MTVLLVFEGSREGFSAQTIHLVKKALYIILPDVNVSAIRCQQHLTEQVFYFIRALFRNFHNTARRTDIGVVDQHGALLSRVRK